MTEMKTSIEELVKKLQADGMIKRQIIQEVKRTEHITYDAAKYRVNKAMGIPRGGSEAKGL